MTITRLGICILLFATLAILGQGMRNPGMLIQIPQHLQLPTVVAVLPYKITSGITIQNLQLTDVFLRDLDYTWKLSGSTFDVTIPEAVITFHWYYGKDSGIGSFTETHLRLLITWQPNMNAHNRFKIQILSTKFSSDEKRSKSTVNLGGDVKQTVAVEVTNLILNHAKVTFHSGITSAIISVTDSLTAALASDVKLYCPKDKQCIYLNTTLTSKPFRSNSSILIQVSGAPYEQGKPFDGFEPSSALFKTSSADISVQIHKDVGSRVLYLANQINPFSTIINSAEISSVTDLNSQTLSMIFPNMKAYGKPRDVLFIIDVLQPSIKIAKGSSLGIVLNCTVSIATQTNGQLLQDTPSSYGYPIKAIVQVDVSTVIRQNIIGARIKNIKLNSYEVDQRDISDNNILPTQILMHLDTLFAWASGGINGPLNQKFQPVEVAGVKANPTVSFLSESIGVDIKLESKDHMKMIDQ